MLGQQSPGPPSSLQPPASPCTFSSANKTISAACFQAPLRQMLHGSQMANEGGLGSEKVGAGAGAWLRDFYGCPQRWAPHYWLLEQCGWRTDREHGAAGVQVGLISLNPFPPAG